MTWLSQPSVMLTVRGTTIAETVEERRNLHNMTAGSDEGVAAARALGDLSHKAYTAITDAPGADANELLFIDIWKDAQGIGTFFSDEQVQSGADMLFSEREASIWMPAAGAFGFDLPTPMRFGDEYVGIVRGVVEDPHKTIELFRDGLEPQISEIRRLGQVSHHLFVTVPMGDDAPLEVIGVDTWADLGGMMEYYQSISGFDGVFSAEPATSIWERGAGGTWTEW